MDTKLIDRYIEIEKIIIKSVNYSFSHICTNCETVCCSEIYCRESIHSPFLSLLTKMQNVAYDNKAGWLGIKGCRLKYGRPLICHKFFCENFLEIDVFEQRNIKKFIAEFSEIGKKAHGDAHLQCVSDLGKISSKKIEKMVCKCNLLISSLLERN